jgi:sensor histidine kinase YesM
MPKQKKEGNKSQPEYHFFSEYSLLKKGIVAFIVISIYTAFFQFFYVWMRYGVIYPYPDTISIFATYFMNFIPLAIQWIMTLVIVFRLRLSNLRWLRIFLNLGCCISSMIIVNILFILVTHKNVEWAGSIFNSFFIFLICETVYYELYSMRMMQEQAEAEKRLLRYQHDIMMLQVKPHFLFNSLNLLFSMVDQDIVKSKDFILSLSNIYRYTLDHLHQEKVMLTEELNFLKAYINILKLRFDNKLNVSVFGEDRVNEQHIIPFSLQILVENVVKHNVITSAQPMEIRIDITDKFIKVSNPIRAQIQPADKGTSHFGISYIESLYSSYNQTINIENTNNNFAVIIPLI